MEEESIASSELVNPHAEELPKPTAWPPTLALGITFIFWGLISSLIITGVGVAVFAVALTGWIGDIRHARKH